MASAPTELLAGPAAADPPKGLQRDDAARRLPPRLRTPALTAAVAAVLCFVTFYAKANVGQHLQSTVTVEIALTLGAGVLVALALVLAQARGDGLWSVALLLAFAILTAISIVWSVQPDASWDDANRMLAYAGVFAAAVALARLAPRRWTAVIGGVTLAAVIVCGYAVLTKVFPGSLAPHAVYARLEEPYGYWNATGLTAAMGAIGCMWLGARRTGHALLTALAYPAMGLVLLTLVLAYSRGALAALAVGVVVWLCVVPLRLRGCAVLIAGALGAAGVAAWDFSDHALSSEGVGLAERTNAGHELGALVLAMLLALSLVGIAIVFATGRRAPSMRMRQRAGALLAGLVVLAVIAFAAALAHSHRGFTGSISHAVSSLTNPNARTPPNTPGRLTAVASVRARYWKEALQVFQAHPWLGAGAEGYQTARLRYRRAPLVVTHAHGFVVQTLADLGVVGLALALALLAAWLAAAGRATHPLDRRWSAWRAWLPRTSERPGWRRTSDGPGLYTAERVALLSMLALVVVFGVHSLVDWTWYVPGNACAALLLAGWLAGRGEIGAPALAGPAGAVTEPDAAGDPRERAPRPPRKPARNARLALAALVIVGALLAAWSQWQPRRAEDARLQALEVVAKDPAAALADARTAVSRDPLSAEALVTLAQVQQLAGQPAQARATLAKAVSEQPSNPQTWLALARYDLNREPRAALHELQAAIYLDPESIAPEMLARKDAEAREGIEIYNDYVQTLRATGAQ